MKIIIGAIAIGFLWLAMFTAALVNNIEWLGMACIIVAIAAVAWSNASRDIAKRNQAQELAEINGADWAIKELVLNPDMDRDYAEGIRRAIRSME